MAAQPSPPTRLWPDGARRRAANPVRNAPADLFAGPGDPFLIPGWPRWAEAQAEWERLKGERDAAELAAAAAQGRAMGRWLRRLAQAWLPAARRERAA
jgi:hypothetical protein